MKLNTDTVRSEAHGFQESNSFTIQGDVHMFSSLIDNAYSDKIRAGLREISANAWDANKDVPIDVTLPTRFDPVFKVRDYGPGMSHAFIMDLFTRLGFSAKRDTNDEVGGFGIGSKAPFAYTDAFTVTSWHEHTKSIYSAYRQPDGMPALAFVHSEPSTEPSGVEVQYPVKSSDVMDFSRAAHFTYVGFEPYPNIKNDDYVSRPHTLMSGSNWKLISHSAIGGPHVRMGCVIYPIDLEQLRKYRKGFTLRSVPLIIDLPVGSLRIQTSREALGYSTDTINTLTECIDKLHDELLDQFNKQLDRFSNLFEANEYYFDYIRAQPEIERAWNWVGPQFNGQKLNGYVNFNFACHILDTEDVSDIMNYKKRLHGYRASKEQRTYNCSAAAKFVFVYDDKPHASLMRLTHYIQTEMKGRISHVIWFRDDHRPLIRAIFGDNATVVTLSDVELPSNAKAIKKSSCINARFLGNEGVRYSSEEFSLENNTGIYVDRYKNLFQFSEWRSTNCNYEAGRILMEAISIGLIPPDTTILVTAADTRPKIHASKNWISFLDYVKMKTVHIDWSLYEEYYPINDLVNSELGYYLPALRSIINHADAPKDIIELYEEGLKAQQWLADKKEDYRKLVYRKSLTAESFPDLQKKPTIMEKLDNIRSKYMLFHTVCRMSRNEPSVLIHYLSSVDKAERS